MRQRVWTKLEARIALAGPLAHSGPSSSPSNPDQLGADNASLASSHDWVSAALKVVSKPVLLSFGIGLASGVGLHASLQSPEAPARQEATAPIKKEASPQLEPPRTAPVVIPQESPPPPARDDSRPADQQGGPRSVRQPNMAKSGGADRSKQDARLAAERALLERAQTALARRNPQGAIEALYRHQADFTDGELVEEREALLIRALVESGEGDKARQHAARFREQFPKSVFLSAIERVLAAEPIKKTPP